MESAKDYGRKADGRHVGRDVDEGPRARRRRMATVGWPTALRFPRAARGGRTSSLIVAARRREDARRVVLCSLLVRKLLRTADDREPQGGEGRTDAISGLGGHHQMIISTAFFPALAIVPARSRRTSQGRRRQLDVGVDVDVNARHEMVHGVGAFGRRNCRRCATAEESGRVAAARDGRRRGAEGGRLGSGRAPDKQRPKRAGRKRSSSSRPGSVRMRADAFPNRTVVFFLRSGRGLCDARSAYGPRIRPWRTSHGSRA